MFHSFQTSVLKEVTKRLDDKDYDEKLKILNKARVKKYRAKKKNESGESTAAEKESGSSPESSSTHHSDDESSSSAGSHTRPHRVIVTLPAQSRQSKDGVKRRRQTLREKNGSIDELNNQVKACNEDREHLEEENIKLVRKNIDLESKVKALTVDKNNQFEWFKEVLKYCSPAIHVA